ncbi:chalcone isomerase family protein [Flavobacterium chuncheonense]|uniref:Chalcone isomerase family protein n=1 Tax=Flavobacterium chuncheonense TaxID=2026653 RepID=A0ABW5YHH6_9FLAO
MKRFFCTALVLFFALQTFSQSTIEVDGISIPKTLKFKDGKSKTKLNLNGYGIRDKMWINLYTQALYLENETDDAEKILNSNETIATRLFITSSMVSKKKLIQAIEDGVQKSYQGDISAVRERLDKFKAFFEKEITKNGFLDFVYTANDGVTSVYANEELIGEIEGQDFRKMLFGIWLEVNAVDKTLKKRLLGD